MQTSTLTAPRTIISVDNCHFNMMPEITWTEPFLDQVLSFIPLSARKILDVGTGRGIVGALIKIYRESLRLVGIETYEPYIEFISRMGFYDEIVKWDLCQQPLPFKDRDFDVAVCLEVVEHLPRDKADSLLEELVRIADRVIVSTPNEFIEQPEYDGNPHQRHLSEWTVSDFRRKKFVTRGVGTLQIFGHSLRYLSYWLRSLTYPFPALSSHIMAVYDRSGNIPHLL